MKLVTLLILAANLLVIGACIYYFFEDQDAWLVFIALLNGASAVLQGALLSRPIK